MYTYISKRNERADAILALRRLLRKAGEPLSGCVALTGELRMPLFGHVADARETVGYLLMEPTNLLSKRIHLLTQAA